MQKRKSATLRTRKIKKVHAFLPSKQLSNKDKISKLKWKSSTILQGRNTGTQGFCKIPLKAVFKLFSLLVDKFFLKSCMNFSCFCCPLFPHSLFKPQFFRLHLIPRGKKGVKCKFHEDRDNLRTAWINFFGNFLN